MSAAKAKRPPTRIQRSGTGHQYFLDGEKCPGVTTIIKEAVPMPALVGWSARTVAEYVFDRISTRKGAHDGEKHYLADELVEDLRAFNEERRYPEKLTGDFPRVGLTKVLSAVQYADRDAAANRGTEVHRLAWELSHGEEADVPEELTGHVDAYMRFLDDFQPTDAIIERAVINRRWRYMGRFDLVAVIDHPDLGRTLIDLKTARSGIYGEVALQLAAYRYAETMLVDDAGTEEPMVEVDHCAALWVRADGYDLYPVDAGEGAHRIFLYCAQVSKAMNKDTGFIANARHDALTPPEREKD